MRDLSELDMSRSLQNLQFDRHSLATGLQVNSTNSILDTLILRSGIRCSSRKPDTPPNTPPPTLRQRRPAGHKYARITRQPATWRQSLLAPSLLRQKAVFFGISTPQAPHKVSRGSPARGEDDAIIADTVLRTTRSAAKLKGARKTKKKPRRTHVERRRSLEEVKSLSRNRRTNAVFPEFGSPRTNSLNNEGSLILRQRRRRRKN